MTIPRTTAKKLCTDTEYRLVNESFAPQVSELSEKGLAQRIRRARTARDKYRSLAQRQTREARGRISPRGTRAAAGNSHTVTKQQLFDETLARFEKQAARSGASQPAARQAASKSSKKAASPAKKTAASVKKTAASAKKSAAPKGTAQKSAAKKNTAKKNAVSSTAVKKAAAKSAIKTVKTATAKKAAKPSSGASAASMAGKTAASSAAKPGKQGDTGKAAAKPGAYKKSASSKPGAAQTRGKPAAPAEARKSSAKTAGKKKTARASASRSGTITKPVKIPPLMQVIAAVSEVVAARKEQAQSAVPAPPTRSPKAPAQTNDGAPPGIATVPAVGVNAKGPEFPRNPHERGRLGAAFKRQQARRDSR